MGTTIDLLEWAERQIPLMRLAKELGYERSTLAQAKRRGHMSPPMTVDVARRFRLDENEWAATAAREQKTRRRG